MSDESRAALAPRLDHLGQHRRWIVVRALAAGMAGAVPAPFVDDWIASLVRRRAIRRLADLRQVDLSEEAVRALADGREPPPSWKSVFKGTALSMFLRRAWKRALLMLALAKRADETGRTFSLLTLFDHYCARMHVGAALEVEEARRLRAAIDAAVIKTRGGLTFRLLKRGLGGAGRALVRAPLELVDAATGGALRRLLANNEEARAEEVVDDALARAAAHEKGFLARGTRAVEAELASAGNAWQAEIVEAFEAAWQR